MLSTPPGTICTPTPSVVFALDFFPPLTWKKTGFCFPRAPWLWLEPRALAVALGVTAMPTGPKNSRDLGAGQSLGCLPKPWQRPQGHRDRAQVMPWVFSPSRSPQGWLNWDLGNSAPSQPLEELFLAPEQGLHIRKWTFSTQEGLSSHPILILSLTLLVLNYFPPSFVCLP